MDAGSIARAVSAQSYDAKSGNFELPNKLGPISSLPKCVDGTSPRSTSSSMGSRRGRNWLKSSLDCADVAQYATGSCASSCPVNF
jgi:hypothetical protein